MVANFLTLDGYVLAAIVSLRSGRLCKRTKGTVGSATMHDERCGQFRGLHYSGYNRCIGTADGHLINLESQSRSENVSN
jgi:hypothetical protein